MTLDELRERYVEFQMEVSPELEDFLREVQAGRYGPVSREVLAAFLDAVEMDILAGIETMVRARPELAAQREEVEAERRAWLRTLRQKYLR